MSPHAKHLDDAFGFEDLLDQAAPNVDAAGVCAAQDAEELLKGRWFLKRIN
jgi:hypothetical protein